MKITTLGFCASIYVPTTIGESINHMIGKHKSIEIAKQITALFNGANIREVSGYYKAKNRSVISETTYVVTCFVAETEKHSLISALQSLAVGLCSDMKQECVAIEYGGEMHLISI